jgi:Spy/CpxP family protein refolding chaperone
MARMPAAGQRMRPDSATRAQRWALMDERRTAIRGVLTPDQQTVFDQNTERMRASRPRRP